MTGIFLAWVSASNVGKAQSLTDRAANVGVRDRVHPEYEPLGLRIDGLSTFLTLYSSVVFDDNIYAVDLKTADTIFSLGPNLKIQSDWNRNNLEFDIQSEFDYYLFHPSQNISHYTGSVIGRLDVDSASQISLLVSAARLTQPRISQNTFAGVLRPVPYDLIHVDLSSFRDFDRLKISGNIVFSHYSVENVQATDGAEVQEDFQDHDELAGTIRGQYALSPMTTLFIEATPNEHTYRLSPPLAPVRRDSGGFNALGGINFQLSHLVTGEIGVGYQLQRYAGTNSNEINGVALRGGVTWFASPLITINLHGDRTFQDSGLPNIAASKVTDANLTTDYELLRNLLISGRLSYNLYDYPGFSRQDARYGVSISASYLINRTIGLTLGYDYADETSSGAASGLSFNDNRLTVTLVLRQ